ncbi:5958_t:CDS:1, partial [Dentiscutata heterogama]
IEITPSLHIIIEAVGRGFDCFFYRKLKSEDPIIKREFEKITEQGTVFYDCCVMSIAYSDRLGIYADGLMNLRQYFEGNKNYD